MTAVDTGTGRPGGGAQTAGYVHRLHREPGLHHLVYEIVDNSIDEALAGYCDRISVESFREMSSVSDDGRRHPVGIQPKLGIPALRWSLPSSTPAASSAAADTRFPAVFTA